MTSINLPHFNSDKKVSLITKRIDFSPEEFFLKFLNAHAALSAELSEALSIEVWRLEKHIYVVSTSMFEVTIVVSSISVSRAVLMPVIYI